MTNYKILKLAIEKADKNGFNDDVYYSVIFSHEFAKAFWGEQREIEKYKEMVEGNCNNDISLEEYNDLSEEDRRDKDWMYYSPVYKYAGWQYHLQQMVLEEEPVKYLEKFI